MILQKDKVYVDFGGKDFYFKVQVREREAQFYYSLDGKNFAPFGDMLDMHILSDERISGNGFTGAMVGVTCQDLGGTGCEAQIYWVDYQPVEDLSYNL